MTTVSGIFQRGGEGRSATAETQVKDGVGSDPGGEGAAGEKLRPGHILYLSEGRTKGM